MPFPKISVSYRSVSSQYHPLFSPTIWFERHTANKMLEFYTKTLILTSNYNFDRLARTLKQKKMRDGLVHTLPFTLDTLF